MAILNLLLRPISTFFLYKILQDRQTQFGDGTDFDNPNLGGILGPGPGRRGPYEDIDRPISSPQVSQPTVVDLASPVHWTFNEEISFHLIVHSILQEYLVVS